MEAQTELQRDRSRRGRDLGEDVGTLSLGSCNQLSSNHVLSLGQVSGISIWLVLASKSRDRGEVPIHPLVLWSIVGWSHQAGTWWGWADSQKIRGVLSRGRGGGWTDKNNSCSPQAPLFSLREKKGALSKFVYLVQHCWHLSAHLHQGFRY